MVQLLTFTLYHQSADRWSALCYIKITVGITLENERLLKARNSHKRVQTRIVNNKYFTPKITVLGYFGPKNIVVTQK